MSEQQDIYSRITNRIIADLDAGTLTWQKPWQTGHAAGSISRPLRASGIPYQGINVIILWASALEKGFVNPLWLTYKQAHELGGQVRKSEKGSLVVYANKLTITDTDENGETEEKQIPFMKGYTVFNAEQVDGLPKHFYTKPEPRPTETEGMEAALDTFFINTKAIIRHGGDRAYYAPAADHVQMPLSTAFRDAESYHATLAHEMTHWTSHATRLNREFGCKRWGDAGYAMEELVAEIGAAFLCADLGLTPELRPDHAAYIASWLSVLKQDKRAIFTAASHAQRAVDHLHSYQPQEQAAA